jgi:hypothetical protein
MQRDILKQTKVIAKFGEFSSYLDAQPAKWEPPGGDQKLKRLNLVMAACLFVRVSDEMKRRASESYASRIYDLRELIEKFHPEGMPEALVEVLREVDTVNEKLAPVSLEAANCVLMALMDAGFAKPNSGATLHDEIINNRAVLMAIASVFSPYAQKVKKEHEGGEKN